MSTQRFGTEYGGYHYSNPLQLSPNPIIYSFGAGEDISHDVMLARVTGAPVHIFDPTPRAIEHVELVKRVFTDIEKPINSKRFGGGDPNYWTLLLNYRVAPDQLILHPYGLWTSCTKTKFYLPTNPEYVSGSLVPEGRSATDTIDVEVKDLETIMDELGHTRSPDILKLDIECVECDVLDHLLSKTKIRPKYIAVDFDTARTGPDGSKRAYDVARRIMMDGYSVLHERSWDITFLRNDGW